MVLTWILGCGLAMSALALVGGLTAVLRPDAVRRLLLPLVAFSAGALLGGAFFHLIPAAVDAGGNGLVTWGWIAAGFASFFVLEQFLHWHHCHRDLPLHRKPVTVLILIADGIHKLVGGLAVGAAFLADVRLGISAWLAAAAHEVPQELGDFGVLVHGGFGRRQALLLNLLSARAPACAERCSTLRRSSPASRCFSGSRWPSADFRSPGRAPADRRARRCRAA